MSKFKVGDVVRLKSGSPRMTVEQVEEYAGNIRIRVAWFAIVETDESHKHNRCRTHAKPVIIQHGAVYRTEFHPDSLIHAE